MPDLSLSEPGRSPSQEAPARETAGGMEQAAELPGARDGLDADAATGLEEVRQNTLQSPYGDGWEAAGERLGAAFEAEGASAYERLGERRGDYGPVTGEGAEHAAATLWVREQVLAEARGETLPGSYRSTEAREDVGSGPSGGETLGVEPPRRLRPGESFHYSSDLFRAVPVGGLPGTNSGLAGAFRPSHTPLTISVRGAITVDSVRNDASGHQMAQISVNAHSEASTNGYGPIRNVCTGGRLVEVTRYGDGTTIPFTLRRDPNGVVIPDSVGGSQELGSTRLTVPAGRTYRAEFDMATNLPNRSATLSRKTYASGEFTPVGPNARR